MQASSATSGALSLLSPLGYHIGDCGYCKADDTSASYYANTKSLSPEHYQELMRRGWRRSGKLLYLPDGSRSCCPHYTIRLPAAEFKPSRDQRQALHRWNRYVLGDEYVKQVRAKHPRSKDEKKHANNTFDLCTAVHESEDVKVKIGIPPAHNFHVELEPDTYTDEKFALYKDYQQHVHHETLDEVTKDGFERFLCSSPVRRSVRRDGMKMGSFHQCYRLDGKLIAIGVLDLLPQAVSGVYFIYHPDFEKWSFGKISALREATLTLEDNREYYYMGYYVHGCKKMRYKGDYKPQYVLDFDSLAWDAMDDDMRSLMDRRKFVRMSKERQRHSRSDDTGAGEEAGIVDGEALTADSYGTVSYPDPLDATRSGLSLMELGMPGVASLERLKECVDLDAMKISLGDNRLHLTSHITVWGEGSEMDSRSIKGIIAEYAACVGPVVANEAIVDFSRS